ARRPMHPSAPWPLLVCTRRSAEAGRRPKTPGSEQKEELRRRRTELEFPKESYVYLRRSSASQQTLRSECGHSDDRRSLAWAPLYPTPAADAKPARPGRSHVENTRSVRRHTIRDARMASSRTDRVISASGHPDAERGKARSESLRRRDVPEAPAAEPPLRGPADPVFATFLSEEHVLQSASRPQSCIQVLALAIEFPECLRVRQGDVDLPRLPGWAINGHLQIDVPEAEPEELKAADTLTRQLGPPIEELQDPPRPRNPSTTRCRSRPGLQTFAPHLLSVRMERPAIHCHPPRSRVSAGESRFQRSGPRDVEDGALHRRAADSIDIDDVVGGQSVEMALQTGTARHPDVARDRDLDRPTCRDRNGKPMENRSRNVRYHRVSPAHPRRCRHGPQPQVSLRPQVGDRVTRHIDTALYAAPLARRGAQTPCGDVAVEKLPPRPQQRSSLVHVQFTTHPPSVAREFAADSSLHPDPWTLRRQTPLCRSTD
ncbi:MAG: hypothetical protein K0S37_4296, partial [Microbacterium sp.]|nr:hypothetical protein [Microbacterium sp.]